MIRRRASALSRPPTSDLAERDEAIRLRSSDDRSLPPPFPMVFCRDRNPPPCNSQALGRGFPSHHHPAQFATTTHQNKPWPPYPVVVQGLCLCIFARDDEHHPSSSWFWGWHARTARENFAFFVEQTMQTKDTATAVKLSSFASWFGGDDQVYAVLSPPRAIEPINVFTNEPPPKFQCPPTSCQEEPHDVGENGCGDGRASLLARSPPSHPIFAPSRTSMLSTRRDSPRGVGTFL